MNTALVLVDIQQDYFPNGRMEVVGATEASQTAKTLLDFCREERLPVVHIQHISTRPGATYFLPDTDGVDFHQFVMPLPEEKVIRKHFPNSFRNTELESHLQSIGTQRLVICGMMTHMCIDTTTRAAFDKGYNCVVVHDACATRNLFFNGVEVSAAHVQSSYMAAIGSVFAKVLSAEDTIGLLQNT